MSQLTLQSADGILITNDQGQPLLIVGTAVPTASQKGVAPGCLYIRTGASPALYNNTGTAAAATWTAIS
jgi:hypothetical protein